MRSGSVGPSVQENAKVSGDRLWFVVELRPGEAGDAVAGNAEASVTPAVIDECGTGAMARPAIELDDLALGAPEAVDPVAPPSHIKPGVERRSGQPVVIQKAEKPLLERTLDPAGRFLEPGKGEANGTTSAPPWIATEQVREREAVIQPPVFHLPQRALDDLGRLHSREVEDSPRHGGDRNPLPGRDLISG